MISRREQFVNLLRNKRLVVPVAAAGVVLAGLTGGAAAYAGAQAEEPSSIVEDYSYPGADQILATQNVRLVSGDGHIVLADCATPPAGDIGLIKVFTTDETIGADGIGRVCFKVIGSKGLLNLEVPAVFEIRGDGQRTGTGHEGTAHVRTDEGDSVTVPLDPDGSAQVGIGVDPSNSPTTLLRLTITG